MAVMPSVRPVQAICQGGSTRWIVEVIVPGPAFQLNTDPGATGPCTAIDFTSGFQLGQCSKAVSTSHTASGAAAISISLAPTTGARSLIAVGFSFLRACVSSTAIIAIGPSKKRNWASRPDRSSRARSIRPANP